MNVDLGGYRASDIVVSAAFDVNSKKVGKDVAEAIFATPNTTFQSYQLNFGGNTDFLNMLERERRGAGRWRSSVTTGWFHDDVSARPVWQM